MKLRTVVGLVLGVALSGSAAWAQQGGTGSAPKASWNYARGGAVAARRPGLMVSQGVQRYSNAQNDIISRARQGPEITDTLADRPTKPITQAKAEAISRINQRHATLLAVGPVAFAKMGRDDKDRYKAIQLLNHGYESALYTEPAPD